jgi:glutathione S-transferase
VTAGEPDRGIEQRIAAGDVRALDPLQRAGDRQPDLLAELALRESLAGGTSPERDDVPADHPGVGRERDLNRRVDLRPVEDDRFLRQPFERAVNRAWTDYVPTFAEVTAVAYADSEADYAKAAAQIPVPFERLEKALEKQGSGPLFNGARYSLVDAAYAPFLQRYAFLDRVKRLGHIDKFPRLKAWSDALLARPSTHSFPEAEFEAMYRDNLRRRNKWVSQFIAAAQVAAE